MNLCDLPRTERLDALKKIMKSARTAGFHGVAGECGEAAVVIKWILFGGDAKIVAGLNDAFAEHGQYVGHYAVAIPDEEFGQVFVDDRGIPFGADDLEAWGMLAPDDSDWADRATEMGFEFTDEVAGTASLYEYDSDREVLEQMPGSGLQQKARLLGRAAQALGFDSESDIRLARRRAQPA